MDTPTQGYLCSDFEYDHDSRTNTFRCPKDGEIENHAATPTATCTGKSKGKKRGDGYKDACCLTNSDCINNCVKGKCGGPSPIVSLPTNCKKGVQGKKNGRGLTNYCCISMTIVKTLVSMACVVITQKKEAQALRRPLLNQSARLQ